MERLDEGKTTLLRASQNENISDIAPGKIPEYLIVSEGGNYVE